MSKRLLLADDSITIQKVIQITFAHEDYELTITDNGESAFARAKELVPDLVLADVYMPGRNGYELCAAIKQDPALMHIPVLLLAGSFEPFDEGKARASGADAWIEKPFESQALIDRVDGLLGMAARRAAPVEAPVAAPVPAPAAPVAPAVPVVPETVDPFADISFEEPAAAAVPPAALAASTDDWSDLNEQPAAPAAPPAFDFVEEPFPAATAAPAVFAEPAPAASDLEIFGDAEEVMALGDEDILGAEDLEPAAEMSTLTPWSRDDLAVEESFETFAEPVAAPPVAELPPVMPMPVPPPAAETAPAAAEPTPVMPVPPPVEVETSPPVVEAPPAVVAAAVEQRVATLSEAEIEQIVERAVGKVIARLAGSVLEKVAWEVVPDLAETLIKEEIRKIKDAAA